jgi:hypothetical protein
MKVLFQLTSNSQDQDKAFWDAAKKSLDVGHKPVNLRPPGGIKAL